MTVRGRLLPIIHAVEFVLSNLHRYSTELTQELFWKVKRDSFRRIAKNDLWLQVGKGKIREGEKKRGGKRKNRKGRGRRRKGKGKGRERR